jgi:glycosyltransferase involved in cell wall biosynthesis
MKLSVALAVHNEESTIVDCLQSVGQLADEIVVVDGSSTDNTVVLAEKFTGKIIKTDNPAMFHINKQKALEVCTGEWILQLDADEIVTQELKAEILQVIQKSENNGYYIPRKNIFWGHFMKKGGQYPDYVMRLVRNGKARFPCKNVHEQISVDGNIGYLKKTLLHYSYRTSRDYWKKADRYTTLTAHKMKSDGVLVNTVSWIRYMILKPIETFFSLFIRHKGFMDGLYGFVFACWSAQHFSIAYKKYCKMV